MAEWPRQPCSGSSVNAAQRYSSGSTHYIQLRNSSGTWVNSFYVTTSSRADTIVSKLNYIFNNYPGADLDFITPSWENGSYVVVWSGVTWSQYQAYSTTTTHQGTTYENLYAGCVSTFKNYPYSSRSNVQLIATVTSAYGMNEWEVALTWANSIRSAVNGWNCTKDSTGGYLYFNGYIPKLTVPSSSYSGPTITRATTFYGCGETQAYFTTANGNISHACDLTVARPSDTSWSQNMWIRLTLNGISVVARVVDVCGTTNLDLTSGGVAYALNCYNNQTVTISAP